MTDAMQTATQAKPKKMTRDEKFRAAIRPDLCRFLFADGREVKTREDWRRVGEFLGWEFGGEASGGANQ